LHDGGGVFVLVFWEVFDVGDGIVESLFGHFAGFTGLVHDFVVENGEVKSKTESDGVGGLQVRSGLFSGFVVSFESGVSNLLVTFTFGVFTDVSVVVTFHFEEEDLAFSGRGLWD